MCGTCSVERQRPLEASKEHPELKLRILRREGAAKVLCRGFQLSRVQCIDTGVFVAKSCHLTWPVSKVVAFELKS